MIDDSETNISVMEAIGLQGFDKRTPNTKKSDTEVESESEQSEKTIPLNDDLEDLDDKHVSFVQPPEFWSSPL